MAYSSIVKPSDYFNTKLYTGNGSTQSITGVGFQPDMTWVKSRSSSAWHNLFDAVRGATKRLQVNSDGAESTETNSLTSFDSDGFTVGSSGDVNGSGNSTVAWNWKANGSGSANTDGSINSTVSANTTAGFSIVSYTGTGANATVGHGLGVVPQVVIARSRSNGGAGWNWGVYHKDLGNTNAVFLNSTAASTSVSAYWNNTSPTSSVFSLGSDGVVNLSSGTFIAYCFAEKTGYSKFGSYTGNGNADGTFVYTGFKPAFVLWKRTEDAGYDWDLYDTARDTHNVAFKELIPNGNGAESSSTVLSLDILSNGFKLRTSNGNGNDSGKPYIYMAFAEEPLVANSGSNGVPATAR
jgi:hypothetical protein